MLRVCLFIQQTAQEKEELKQKGSDLDKQIKKVESENRALENTILMFNHTTSSFRKSLRRVQEASTYKHRVGGMIENRHLCVLMHANIQNLTAFRMRVRSCKQRSCLDFLKSAVLNLVVDLYPKSLCGLWRHLQQISTALCRKKNDLKNIIMQRLEKGINGNNSGIFIFIIHRN